MSTNCRVSEKTKKAFMLIREEIVRINPELKDMKLSENYMIARMQKYYLRDSPYKKDLDELEDGYRS